MRIANPIIGATSVMYVVMKKRAKLLALLTKNGVKYPVNATDMQLALIVTNLLKTSKSFTIEFEQLLSEPEVIKSVFSGMDGAYSNFTFDFTPKKFNENIFATPSNTLPTKPTLPTTTTNTKSSKFSFGNALELLQSGFQGYLALDDNKTKQALANASVQIKQSDVQLAELGVLPSGNIPKKDGLSTGAIVGLSIAGILVVGGAIYFATKNKS
jgi:hypothetical protein